MFEEATTAIITGAASNIVAYMLNGRIDALRAWASRFLPGATEGNRTGILQALEEDSTALTQGVASESDVKMRWGVLLASLLASHPELRAEVDAIAKAPAPAETINIGSQHNHGSGTFVGGHVYGGISLAPRSEES